MITAPYKFVVAILLAGTSLPVAASEALIDGAEAAGNNIFFHAPGADEAGPMSPMGSANDYLFVTGSAFTPRTSTQTITYPGAGCISFDGFVTTDLQLPQGAAIQGVRLYYYDMATPGSVSVYVNSFDGGGNFSSLLSALSTIETGYSSEYFAFGAPVIVDNISQSLSLIASMATGLRFCGMRVFYDAP